MPSDDPDAASRFYAKVFGWTDDARLPGMFHRLNPGGRIRDPEGRETEVANLQFGASNVHNRRPHPEPAGPKPRTLAGAGQKPRIWVLVGEGQSEAMILDTAVKLGGKVLWCNHFWAEFNGYCCSFADPWGNEFVLWSRGGPGAKALPGYTQE
jgi:predicted enzyme related to lactoylglutathione lyase